MLILAVIHDFSYLRCGGLWVWWLDEFFSSDTEKMLLNSELVSQFVSTSQCYAYPAVFGASCLFFFLLFRTSCFVDCQGEFCFLFIVPYFQYVCP